MTLSKESLAEGKLRLNLCRQGDHDWIAYDSCSPLVDPNSDDTPRDDWACHAWDTRRCRVCGIWDHRPLPWHPPVKRLFSEERPDDPWSAVGPTLHEPWDQRVNLSAIRDEPRMRTVIRLQWFVGQEEFGMQHSISDREMARAGPAFVQVYLPRILHDLSNRLNHAHGHDPESVTPFPVQHPPRTTQSR